MGIGDFGGTGSGVVFGFIGRGGVVGADVSSADSCSIGVDGEVDVIGVGGGARGDIIGVGGGALGVIIGVGGGVGGGDVEGVVVYCEGDVLDDAGGDPVDSCSDSS